MTRSKTYKLISLTMALLVFFSSSGFTLDIHFCQGAVKRLNLFGKAKSCSELSQSLSKCHHNNKTKISCGADDNHDDCCKNQSFELDVDFDSEEISTLRFSDSKLSFVYAYELGRLVFNAVSTSLKNYTDYYPPPKKRDICVLFQIFLL